MQVSFSTVQADFQAADQAGNGQLTKPEIAQEALNLLDSGKTDEFSLFATFLQGGASGQGLWPGQNSDTLSLSDLSNLAGQDGDATNISSADFNTEFGSTAVGSGNTIDVNALQTEADQAVQPTDIFSQILQALTGTSSGLAGLGNDGSNVDTNVDGTSNVLQLMMTLLTSVLGQLGGSNSSTQNGNS